MQRKNLVSISFLVMCLWLSTQYCAAQDFVIKNFEFPAYSGLGEIHTSGNSVWVATRSGAARYNGFSWEFLDKTNGLDVDSVQHIVTDSQQATWFMGSNGVAILTGNTWKYFFQDQYCYRCVLDKTGDEIWLSYPSTPGLMKITATDTLVYPTTTLGLVGVERSSSGYMGFDYQNTYTLYKDHIQGDTATSLYNIDFHIDKENNKWLVGGGEIFLRKFNSGVYKKVDCPISAPDFNNVTSDKYGNMYFGTWNKGLIIKTKDTWFQLDASKGLADNNIADVAVDDNDNIWISNRSGVSVIANGWIDNTNGVKGIIYWDANNDGKKDAGENGLPNQHVELETGGYAISNADGEFFFRPADGENTITVLLKDFWEQGASPISYTFTYPNATLPSFEIGLKWKIVTDVAVTLSGNGFRPGFDTRQYLLVTNEGSVVSNAGLALDYDPKLSFLESSPSPTIVEAGHLEWNTGDLHPLHSQSIVVTFNLPPTVPLGAVVKNIARISPVDGETNLTNNIDSLKTTVTGSLDPNDKLVAEGILEKRWVEMGTRLTYTIRFQNTGTDTAFMVKIKDQLDPYLDIRSLEILASSHPVNYSLEDRLLKFVFPNIKLPDSIRNEPGSHGYVKYRIGALNTISDNTLVKNSAAIYFDFNEPVLTNEVRNTFVNELPGNEILGVEDFGTGKPVVYPNPGKSVLIVSANVLAHYSRADLISASGFSVKAFDLEAGDGKLRVDEIPSGLYFIRLSGKNKVMVTKVVLVKDN